MKPEQLTPEVEAYLKSDEHVWYMSRVAVELHQQALRMSETFGKYLLSVVAQRVPEDLRAAWEMEKFRRVNLTELERDREFRVVFLSFTESVAKCFTQANGLFAQFRGDLRRLYRALYREELP